MEQFSVPFGWREGEPLIAAVSLSAALKPGDLRRIAKTLQRLAPLAEETLADEETPLAELLLAGER